MVAESLELAGYALGALGAALLFMEFFQFPSYVEYKQNRDKYRIDMGPSEVREHTWIGRAGAILVAVAFALLFFATLAG